MNVLFTSAGRRGYLLRWFRESGFYKKIVAVNSEPCSAFAHADFWNISPQTSSKDYKDFIFATVAKHSVDLVIPLTDIDSFALSKMRSELLSQGVAFLGPKTTSVATMLDKALWPKVLKPQGFPVPRTYIGLEESLLAVEAGEIDFPVLVKARVGTSSALNAVALNRDQLVDRHRAILETGGLSFLEAELDIRPSERAVCQEFVVGVEHGVDLLADLSGNFDGYLARRKVRMRAGETEAAETLPDLEAGFSFDALARAIGAVGLVDLDIMVKPKGPAVILDINPRIGGGYPLSHLAGADLPSYVNSWLGGERARLDQSVIRKILVEKEVGVVEVPVGHSSNT